MNERIKTMWVEATGSMWPRPGKFTAGEYDTHLEKFAELIIAKCIEEAGDPADGLILGDTWHDGVRASIWSIKQHFGIE